MKKMILAAAAVGAALAGSLLYARKNGATTKQLPGSTESSGTLSNRSRHAMG